MPSEPSGRRRHDGTTDERPGHSGAGEAGGLPTERPDAVRLARLEGFGLAGEGAPMRSAVVASAALIWSRTAARRPGTDQRAMSILVSVLLDDAAVHGEVNSRRALRRASVDRWLTRTADGRKPGSARTYRTTLYTAGRVLFPREYPAPQAVSASRTKTRPVVSGDAVRNVYLLAPGLPELLRRRVLLILDLCAGAGLHTDELRNLRGSDIQPLDVDGSQTALVHIQSSRSQPRDVPVVHPAKAARLLQTAAEAGSEFVLATGRRDRPGKNLVNSVTAALRDRGYPGMSPEALRNRWLLDLSERVPAVVLLQLAGVNDLRILSDQRNQLVIPKTLETARILIEAAL